MTNTILSQYCQQHKCSDLMSTYLQRFIMQTRSKTASIRTLDNHRNIIKNSKFKIQNSKYSDAEKYILEKCRSGISPGYQNTLLSVLDSWLSFLADYDEIDHSIAEKFHAFKKKAYDLNPYQKEKQPFEAEHLKKFLSTLQIRRCIEARRTQDMIVIGFMLMLGYRINEVLNIKLENVKIHEDYKKYYKEDGNRDYSKESKENIFYAVIEIPWKEIKWHSESETGMYRKVLWETAEFAGINFYKLLKKHISNSKFKINNSKFLFANLRNGTGQYSKISQSYYNKLFPKILNRSGISISYTPHQLRHTFASYNYEIPRHIMSEMFGHKKKKDDITGRYQQVKPEELDQWYKTAQENIKKRGE